MNLSSKLPFVFILYISSVASLELETYFGLNTSLSKFTNSCNHNASSCDDTSSSFGVDINGEIDKFIIGSSFSKFGGLKSTTYNGSKDVSGYRLDVYGLMNIYEFNERNDLNFGFGISNHYLNYKKYDSEVEISPSVIINYKYNFYSDFYISPSYIFAYDIDGSNEHRLNISLSKKVKYSTRKKQNNLNSKGIDEKENKVIQYEQRRITIDEYGLNEEKIKESKFNMKSLDTLKDESIHSYVLYGHSSTNENNQVSFNRAKYIKDLLINNGVEPNKVKIIDMGKNIHVADNSVAIGELLSRRVTIEYLWSND